jgi:hypothetical protein
VGETEYDDEYSIHNQAGERANAYMVVESAKFTPLLVALAAVALFVAGISLGMAAWAMHRADAAEREALVAKLRTEGFTRALISKGIDPYPHLTGENP